MKVRKIPQRMCVGCKEMKEKKQLLRVVRTPEGDIVIDKTGKKAGRGAYVCYDKSCIEKAYKQKSLEKALEKSIDSEIYENLLTEFDK